MRIRVSVLAGLALVGITADLHAQVNDPGRQVFESRCARCHGADGNGGEMGPPIVTRLTPLDDQQLAKVIRDGVPAKVTAFREDMAVHGKYGKPCPECGTKVQRIRYASNEVNYCPRCQTDGKVLADRGLSRLLGADWPRSIEELEERQAAGEGTAPATKPEPRKSPKATPAKKKTR